MIWEIVKLGSLCHKITDGSHNPPKGIDESAFMMLSSKNIFHDEIHFENPRYLTSKDFEQENKRTDVSENDILLTIVGTVGRVAIVSEKHPKFTLQRSVAVLKPCVDLINPRFLMYSLRNLTNLLLEGARGVAQQGIYLKQIRELKVPYPPLPEQKKIAEILDAADSLRQKDQQLIEHYNTLSQSLFLDMFGDPVTNPMGWEKKHLKEMGKVSTGNTPPRANPDYYGDHIEWIKTNNINTPNQCLTPAEEYLSSEGLDVGRSVDAGSLLVTCIAGSKKVIGNVAIANRKVAFNQQINSFTPLSGNVLYYYHLFVVGKKHIQKFSTNSMKGMISKSKFESIDFISTPVKLQSQFAERIQLLDAQVNNARASLQKSEDLFNSLLQRAFKGELTS